MRFIKCDCCGSTVDGEFPQRMMHLLFKLHSQAGETYAAADDVTLDICCACLDAMGVRKLTGDIDADHPRYRVEFDIGPLVARIATQPDGLVERHCKTCRATQPQFRSARGAKPTCVQCGRE